VTFAKLADRKNLALGPSPLPLPPPLLHRRRMYGDQNKMIGDIWSGRIRYIILIERNLDK